MEDQNISNVNTKKNRSTVWTESFGRYVLQSSAVLLSDIPVILPTDKLQNSTLISINIYTCIHNHHRQKPYPNYVGIKLHIIMFLHSSPSRKSPQIGFTSSGISLLIHSMSSLTYPFPQKNFSLPPMPAC